MGALGGALAHALPAQPTALHLRDDRWRCVLVADAAWARSIPALLAVACINFKADQTIVRYGAEHAGHSPVPTVIVKAINTAANPDDVSSTIQYAGAKKLSW